MSRNQNTTNTSATTGGKNLSGLGATVNRKPVPKPAPVFPKGGSRKDLPKAEKNLNTTIN